MTPASVLPLVIVVMVVIAAACLAARAARWRQGRPARVDVIAGIAALPKRYLVDVHHVVARDPATAAMHMLAAGGLTAGSVLAALAAVPALGRSRSWWLVVALAFAAVVAGALLEAMRRRRKRPARLPGGAFRLLAPLLFGYGLGGFFVAVGAASGLPDAAGAAGIALTGACGAILALLAGYGPMRHAFAGALHLAAHPRPSRFEGRRDVALAPLDLDAGRLGVETAADFAWNRLVGFDACVQCGRCEAACPASAAGQPLNPRRLIRDLATAMDPRHGAATRDPDPTARPAARGGATAHAPIVGAVIHPDTLWSCTTCRACVEECPMMIEHVDAVIELRRHQTLMTGAVPERAAACLDDLRHTGEAGGHALAARADFRAGLELPELEAGGRTDVLLWLGAGAYDLRHGRTLRALVKLLRAAGVQFATLGEREKDCGDAARRLGDEATFQQLARENVATLASVRFARIVTADPHALNSLRNDYPAFGGHYEVWHHTTLLAALVAEGRLQIGRLKAAVTYHDPCYLGRYNGEVEAPRRLLDALGLDRIEMARHGVRSFCCGGGGGAAVSDVAGDRRIADLRMAQAQATGAATVAVACPTCTAMLEGVTGERPDVRDVAELVLAGWEAGRTPSSGVRP